MTTLPTERPPRAGETPARPSVRRRVGAALLLGGALGALSTVCAAPIAVYFLFNNRRNANHRYTTDIAIREAMIARGYALEGNGPGGATMCAGS